jgi:hypothetical protein
LGKRFAGAPVSLEEVLEAWLKPLASATQRPSWKDLVIAPLVGRVLSLPADKVSAKISQIHAGVDERVDFWVKKADAAFLYFLRFSASNSPLAELPRWVEQGCGRTLGSCGDSFQGTDEVNELADRQRGDVDEDNAGAGGVDDGG